MEITVNWQLLITGIISAIITFTVKYFFGFEVAALVILVLICGELTVIRQKLYETK